MNRSFPSAVVFDLDGLLIDSESVYFTAADRLLNHRGRTLDLDFMHSIMGMPARQILPLFRERFELTMELDELAAEFRERFIVALNGEPVRMMPFANDLIAQLRDQRIPMAIATSSSRLYVEKVFAPHGLMEHFEFVLTADDVTDGKPHPEVYLKAALQLGVAVNAVVVLEDSPNGVRSAKAAGANCVAVPHENTPRSGLAIADLIVPHLGDHRLKSFLGLA